MKLTQRRSGTTVTMSPDISAPAPPSPFAQCSTWPPAKWTPRLMSVRPSPICRVSPSQNSTAGSGRATHARSLAWM